MRSQYLENILSHIHPDEVVTCEYCENSIHLRGTKIYRGDIFVLRLLVMEESFPRYLDLRHAFFKEYTRMAPFIKRATRDSDFYNTGYSKLRHWGLVEALDEVLESGGAPILEQGAPDGTRVSGYYRSTERGRHFLKNRIALPRIIYTYAGKVVRIPEASSEVPYVFMKDILDAPPEQPGDEEIARLSSLYKDEYYSGVV